jgi:hypothetical protein
MAFYKVAIFGRKLESRRLHDLTLTFDLKIHKQLPGNVDLQGKIPLFLLVVLSIFLFYLVFIGQEIIVIHL